MPEKLSETAVQGLFMQKSVRNASLQHPDTLAGQLSFHFCSFFLMPSVWSACEHGPSWQCGSIHSDNKPSYVTAGQPSKDL
jgi:hypothetical protein